MPKAYEETLFQDSPEMIAQCLNCPLPCCCNCYKRYGGPQEAMGSFRGPRKAYTDTQHSYDLYKEGKTVLEISKELGIRQDHVRMYIKRMKDRENRKE